MVEPTKRCARCKQELPHSAFGRRVTTDYSINGAIHNKPGPQSYCRTCDSAHAREHRAKRRAYLKSLPPITIKSRAQTRSYPQT